MRKLVYVTLAAIAALLVAAGSAAAAFQFQTAWGTTGTGQGQFGGFSPFVAVGPDGSVYASDGGNNRIQKFTADGVFLTAWGTAGAGPGQFNTLRGVAAGADGSVYVVDQNNNRVQRFDANGGFLSQWGTGGAGDTQFNGPIGIAVGPDGSVYVGDTGNQRVKRFLADGTFVSSFGSGAAGIGISGIAVGPDGSVYVGDTGNSRIERYDASGVFQNAWGSNGFGDGQFQSVQGLAASATGVYVADSTNSRVQKFTATGTLLDKLDGASSGDGQFQGPVGVAITPAGLIYLGGSSRVARYSETDGTTPPPPITGQTANAEVASGTVRVKAPGSRQFVTLTAAQQIPIGSIIDATKGTIKLTTTAGAQTTQTATFFGGVFKLTQTKAAKPVTELQLFGGNFKKACPPLSRRASTSANGKKKVVRQLWSAGTGQFRTKGRYLTAVIRGTEWLTQDRCDGTLTRVKIGSVTVRDLVKKKNVNVTAPNSYLAAPPTPKKP